MSGSLPTVIPEATARELSRAAKNVRTWTKRRDELIVKALSLGAGVREVARMTGMSHPSVLHIQKRDAKGDTTDG